MKSSTRDEVESKVHKIKGEIKETAGNYSIIPNWKLKAQKKKLSAKFKKRPARIKGFGEIERRIIHLHVLEDVRIS